MSTRCADAPEKATSSPSQKIGTTIPMSGVCVAPLYGWLWAMMSPSWIPSSPSSRITPLTIFGIAPMNIGVESDSGDLVALDVEEPGAEVLGLADDRRVGDPEEDRAHLLGDRLEGAADHAHEHGVRQPGSGVGGLGDPCAVDDDVPVAVDLGRQARRHDRRRVVLLDHGRADDRLAGRSALAS